MHACMYLCYVLSCDIAGVVNPLLCLQAENQREPFFKQSGVYMLTCMLAGAKGKLRQ